MRFWRHKTHGKLYRDLGRVTLQASDLAKLSDGCTMVLYVNETGFRSVRAQEEFEDGRFEKILEFEDKRDK